MAYISDADWLNYENVINQASDTFGKEIITWNRLNKAISRFGEDDPSSSGFTVISLECLVQYNANRTWPINKETQSGELDKENIMIILNKEYLRVNNYLDANGYFDFRPDRDTFELHGQKYKPAGDTEVAQTNKNPLLMFVILERMILPTGHK